MRIAPLDSLLSPRLKGVSLLTGVPSILGLAHSWIARWALTGALDVVDCSGAFQPLRILHTLEDQGLKAWPALDSIQVHRPRTALQFLGASRILAEENLSNPVVILSPLYQVIASSSSVAASGLLLDGFRALLASARAHKARVLIVEPEKNSSIHRAGLSALQGAAHKTWRVSARGVESIAGHALSASPSNRAESVRAFAV